MAEFTNIAVQNVAPNANVVFTETPFGCNKHCVNHREGSGVFTLRNANGQCHTLYKVSFGANIAIPTGGTVEEISIALAIEGEALGASTAIITPAAVENYFNVFVEAYIPVDCRCCVTVTVKNISTQAISVQNANLIIKND